ncbi:ABC transporter permease [Candidatus Magnetobacterium casense]|uniref:ABC transporter permease subunit n=1 Tax=Candidatus Magnetobacterium casense TaxID=1455061 RepID=A0ABS6RUT4_9BACT|nr:ABC transporter permease subunit [Candidatus Magnetobacterium casensis]MBV6340207.1 ABC transporter permease subunit [Candidatus Magnetobacterium casensis]
MAFTEHRGALRAIAHKEFSDRLKNKWVAAITVGFTLLTIVVAYFGSAASGVVSFRNMGATVASLTSLVVYFIPMLALTLGGGVIADERDRHTLELYLSAPITAGEFILGKYIGLAVSLAVPSMLGFSIPGLILLFKTGVGSFGSYMVFVINSVALGMVFLSISFLTSVMFYERGKVIGFTVLVWLFFTIVYDLGLVGVLIVTKGTLTPAAFVVMLLLNPVDVYRVLNFTTIGEYSVLMGLASVDVPGFMRPSVLWAVTVLWIAAPLSASYYLFKKRYLA